MGGTEVRPHRKPDTAIASGRKDWLSAGSLRAGLRAVAIMGLLSSMCETTTGTAGLGHHGVAGLPLVDHLLQAEASGTERMSTATLASGKHMRAHGSQ